jgi:hypothetical protein
MPKAKTSRQIQKPKLQKNKDGSFDLYFGPNAPKGKESNWVSRRGTKLP